jgi:hypothetical protein
VLYFKFMTEIDCRKINFDVLWDENMWPGTPGLCSGVSMAHARLVSDFCWLSQVTRTAVWTFILTCVVLAADSLC